MTLIGKIIKLIFRPTKQDPRVAGSERMWVIVTKDLGDGRYEGTLDNEPVGLKSVKCGDTITFHHDDIMNIFDKNTPKPPWADKPEKPHEQYDRYGAKIFRHRLYPKYETVQKIYLLVDEQYDDTFLREEIIVEELGFRKYCIKCTPLCISGLKYNDIITFLPDDNDQYAIEDFKYNFIGVYSKDKDFSFLEKYKKYGFFEQLTEYKIYIAFISKYRKYFFKLCKQIDAMKLADNAITYHSNLLRMHFDHPEYEKLSAITVRVDGHWKKDFMGEQLLIMSIKPGVYRVKCIPACIKNLSYHDIIVLDENGVDYGIKSAEYICIQVYTPDEKDNFLDEYKDKIFIEYLNKPHNVAFAFLRSEEENISELALFLSNNSEKYDWGVKGTTKYW